MAWSKSLVSLLLTLVFVTILVQGEHKVRHNVLRELGLEPSCVDHVLASCDTFKPGLHKNRFQSLCSPTQRDVPSIAMKEFLDSFKQTVETITGQQNSLVEIKADLKLVKESKSGQQTILHFLKEWVKTNAVQEISLTKIEKDLQSLKETVQNLPLQQIAEQEKSLQQIKADLKSLKESNTAHEILSIFLEEWRNTTDAQQNALRQIKAHLKSQDKTPYKNSSQSFSFEKLVNLLNDAYHPKNCFDLLSLGDKESGVRIVYPFPCCKNRSVSVFCDQITDGGGWTLFQRRDTLLLLANFYRDWEDYEGGFGDVSGEFWLGLENIHALVNAISTELRIDLEDFDGDKRWANYDTFSIEDAADKYRLHVEGYSGNAGDGLKRHSGNMFSTIDQDNDKANSENCAYSRRAAWWYEHCTDSNLNGFQYFGQHQFEDEGVTWDPFRGYRYSLKKAEMKVRPKI